jgi:glycosyltransferase involved in cell wall biosynthesis
LTVAFELQAAKDRDKLWYLNTSRQYHEIFLNGFRIGDDMGLCFNVFQLFQKKYDVIVVSGYATPTGMMAVKWLQVRKRPFMISCDGGFIKEDSLLKYRFKRSLISSATAWLSTGKETNRYLCHYGAAADRIYEYPFTSIWDRDLTGKLPPGEKERTKQKLQISEEKVVLSVGRFIPGKGFEVLIRAASTLDRSIGFFIVGGEPTDEFLKLKNEYNLSNLHFVGFKKKEELAEYYLAADLFVLPTKSDVWGLVLNEAMAKGLPIITTYKCIGGLEMIKDGYNGYLTPIDDPEYLADKIGLAFSNQCDLNNMGENSLKVISNYTIEKMALKHIEVFKDYICRSIKK